MLNAKLTFSEMKEMLELFTKHKLNVLKVGDFEVQKSFYETNKPAAANMSQEDLSLYSAAPLPPEMQELINSMNSR